MNIVKIEQDVEDGPIYVETEEKIGDPTAYCIQHRVCPAGREFATGFSCMTEVWENCLRVDWLIYMVTHQPVVNTAALEDYVRIYEEGVVDAFWREEGRAPQWSLKELWNTCIKYKAMIIAETSYTYQTELQHSICEGVRALIDNPFS